MFLNRHKNEGRKNWKPSKCCRRDKMWVFLSKWSDVL